MSGPQVVERSRSLPVYEPGKPLDDVARSHGFEDAQELVKLASNENPLGPSPRAMEAVADAVAGLHRYPDGGTFQLRERLGAHLDIDPSVIVPGNGSNELIELVGHLFLEPGTNLVMSEQAFLVYKLVGLAFGAEVRQAPMQDFAHDLDAMLALIDADTRVVFVANPNNPTGTVLAPEAVRKFVDAVPPHVCVVLDEAYIELLDESARPFTPAEAVARPNLMILRTFSKAYGLAGLRVGYGFGHPELMKTLARFRQPFNVNTLAQVAATAALDDLDHLQRFRAVTQEGLAFWKAACEKAAVPMVPSVANFFLAETGAGRAVFEALQAKGVVARPMDAYGLPNHLRLSVGTEKENQRALVALNALEWTA